MYKIFCLGNSLTADTTRWFSDLSMHEEGYAKTVALLYGGRDTETHAARLIDATPDYDIFINGVGSRLKGNVVCTFPTDEWSHVMIQQRMAQAPDRNAVNDAELRRQYEEIGSYLHYAAPKARILVLNTWLTGEKPTTAKAYKEASAIRYEMAEFAADCLGTERENIVPAGRVIDALNFENISNLWRDTVHMSLSFGRYVAAQTLYSFLSGKTAVTDFRYFKQPRVEEDFLFASIHGMHFAPTDEKELHVAQETIDRILKDPKNMW